MILDLVDIKKFDVYVVEKKFIIFGKQYYKYLIFKFKNFVIIVVGNKRFLKNLIFFFIMFLNIIMRDKIVNYNINDYVLNVEVKMFVID